MYIFRKLWWAYSLCIIAALVLLFGTVVKAQDATGQLVLNVSPTVIEIDANQGNKVTGSFKVVNGSESSITVIATPKNFTAADETGGVDITEDDTNYSVADWVTVSPADTSIEPRGSQIFNYEIDVPIDAEPGGHFGAIIVSTDPTRIDLTGPAVVQEVGPLLLVRVPGDTFEEASIVEFSSGSFYENGPIELLTRIQNTGNVHFKPQGTIEIKNIFGRIVTTIDLEERNVLPDTIRKLSNQWSPGGFTIGRYTAQLTVVYGVDNQIVTASTSFVVFPYKVILPVLIILIVLITFIVRNRRRIRKALSVLKNG